MSRKSWDEYFIDVAKTVAARSTCVRVPQGIGCVLVYDRQILSTGYVGSIRGADHCTEVGCLLDEKTGGCVRTVHAETNAILQAARHGVSIEQATAYTTMSPCWDCFKAFANGGIKRIVYFTQYRTVDRQLEYSKKLGIEFTHLTDGDFYVPAPQNTASCILCEKKEPHAQCFV